jgi:tagatose-1,6-bisphosphate aldolase
MLIDPFLSGKNILMLALDHRGSLEKMLPSSISPSMSHQVLIDIKQMLMESTASLYSGVLLDQIYGLPAYEKAKANPVVASKPYLLCIEKTGYTDTDHERLTQLEYSVSELKAKGAQGVKLLLFFHPDGKTAKEQLALAKDVFSQCQKEGLPFFLEILNYSLTGNSYDPNELVPRSVEMFLKEGIHADVFKLEFPGSADSCDTVTKLLRETPWILLTKGETYDIFKQQLQVAMTRGARGFLAGRSLWQDFVGVPQDEWKKFFETTVVSRFEEICAIAQAR